MRMRVWKVLLPVLVALTVLFPGQAQTPPSRNVVIVTIDGLRWQEMFGGAERDYFKRDKPGEVTPPEKRFWRETPEERRAVLMPFMWKTIATKGQIFGDPAKKQPRRA